MTPDILLLFQSSAPAFVYVPDPDFIARYLPTESRAVKTFNLISPIDVRVVTFDFGPNMPAGIEIDTVTVIASLHSGVDAAPGSRINGLPQLIASPFSAGADQAALVLIGPCVAGATYLLQCEIADTNGETRVMPYLLPCQALQ